MTWPRLGFAYNGERNGRAKSGSTLIHWWLDFGQPDLFDQKSDSESLDAAIDANIFLDLMEERNDESLGLMADWLQESVRLCYTAELLNDVNPRESRRLRLLLTRPDWPFLSASLKPRSLRSPRVAPSTATDRNRASVRKRLKTGWAEGASSLMRRPTTLAHSCPLNLCARAAGATVPPSCATYYVTATRRHFQQSGLVR